MEKTVSTTHENAGPVGESLPALAKKAGEALFFAGVILLSSLAVIALAIAAPFVLAASALAGLLTKNKDAHGWRPVSV